MFRSLTGTGGRKAEEKGPVHRALDHINVATLRAAFYALRRKAAPGADGMTWRDYEAALQRTDAADYVGTSAR